MGGGRFEVLFFFFHYFFPSENKILLSPRFINTAANASMRRSHFVLHLWQEIKLTGSH